MNNNEIHAFLASSFGMKDIYEDRCILLNGRRQSGFRAIISFLNAATADTVHRYAGLNRSTVNRADQQDERHCAEDGGKAAGATEVGAAAADDEAGQQRAADAEQNGRAPAHGHGAGIKEAREGADEETRDYRAEDIDHICLYTGI